MSGTTLCTHCDTRFRVTAAQLEAHHGMVRCGHCLQAFDANRNFEPDQPDPQLELPILDEPAAPAAEHATSEPDIEPASGISNAPLPDETENPLEQEHGAETTQDAELREEQPDIGQRSIEPEDAADEKPVAMRPTEIAVLHPMTLAEQVALIKDDAPGEPEATLPAEAKRRVWPWAIAASLLTLVLLAQTAYFFRIELAARSPGLKPALLAYCQWIECEVPLPQHASLMSIESSDLEADPEIENRITLNALLRNRATYAQAYPDFELTLNDIDDKPLARRVFKPAHYLPPLESQRTGLLPNHELDVKLRLETADLKPTGYRLVLFYPKQLH
ncbi:MAG: DUF3426 domain-containing protein [Nitrosomonadales bacterium]|nr:DUF3426 domain-containing protein [Nitrosomonadales bacterium]